MDKKGELIKTVPVLRGQMARYPSIDPTLTVSGAAADARVTGDKLAEHERRLIIQERQVDASLKVSGAAADAKVTGEKFNEFDERIKQAAEDVSSVPGKVQALEKTTAEHAEQLDAQEKELDVQAKTQKSQADKMAALQKTLDEQQEDIDEKLPAYRLGEAVNEALAQAKASGEFDGVSVTHKWNGTVLEITSASGMKSMDLQGEKGDDGYTPQKGVDYFDGEDGKDGENGADGVSVTHEWDGTVLRVTSASGTTEADLKGDKGDKGDPGEKGETGAQGEQGIQGETGATGATGATGKTAYQYAKEGGYTGTEVEFAAKLAAEYAPKSHKHTKSEISDFPTIPSKTETLTITYEDGTTGTLEVYKK